MMPLTVEQMDLVAVLTCADKSVITSVSILTLHVEYVPVESILVLWQ
jgi:hypothetical protein